MTIIIMMEMVVKMEIILLLLAWDEVEAIEIGMGMEAEMGMGMVMGMVHIIAFFECLKQCCGMFQACKRMRDLYEICMAMVSSSSEVGAVLGGWHCAQWSEVRRQVMAESPRQLRAEYMPW